MKLKLKESNSPFWLIGTGKNGTFAGSSTNIPCYYKSKNKQIEISKQIFKNDKNVEKVYLLSGTQWDNMPSGSKEELGYIKNKGKLILSREDIEECDYPKDVSRDSLPKKGIKTYTSTATTLENKEDSKIKLELKDSSVNNKSKFDDLLANGTQSDFNKLPKDEIKEFANYVKSLDDVSDLIKGIILRGLSFAHGDDLTVENKCSKNIKKENVTKMKKAEGETFDNAGTTWKTIKQNEDDTLIVALDNDGNERNKYVVAYGLQTDGSWNQGHYFSNKDKAMKFFDKREKKQESIKESKDFSKKEIFKAWKKYQKDNNRPEPEYGADGYTDKTYDMWKKILIKEKYLTESKIVSESSDDKWTVLIKQNDKLIDEIAVNPKDPKNYLIDILNELNARYNKPHKLKESKIVTPVGNPQTAGSFVNIDVDLDHMDISDFIVRLAQAIRSEQTAILEYVALKSANGITNEDRSVIDKIIEEEKNHMVAITTLLYKQLLMNHQANVDEANKEFVLPKLNGIFDNNDKLNESLSNILDIIINKSVINEDTKITSKDDKYNIEVDVEYDSDVANNIFDNVSREVEQFNKENEINLFDLGLKDGKFYFSVNKEVNEQMVKDICTKIFDKATNYEYQITIA